MKDVAFQVVAPNGTTWAVFLSKTDENGVAKTSFRLPWPCDNPESYFGKWKVIASVDVACHVVTDSLVFKYDYHMRAWSTILDRPGYQYGEYIRATVYYGTVSMQTFSCVITATATDETGVAFACAFAYDVVGGAEWCTYENSSCSFCLYIPKFPKLGLGTVWVGLAHDLPLNAGDAVYPTKEPETVVHFGIIYDTLMHVTSTTLDSDSYVHGQSMQVTIDFGAMSMWKFPVLFAVSAVDATGTMLSCRYIWADAGGAGVLAYSSQSINLTLVIPKSARAGVGTLYVSVFLDGIPSEGGCVIYPTEDPETIAHFIIEAG
jgi:hypothetical protein